MKKALLGLVFIVATSLLSGCSCGFNNGGCGSGGDNYYTTTNCCGNNGW